MSDYSNNQTPGKRTYKTNNNFSYETHSSPYGNLFVGGVVTLASAGAFAGCLSYEESYWWVTALSGLTFLGGGISVKRSIQDIIETKKKRDSIDDKFEPENKD